jgi:hypothetical protein
MTRVQAGSILRVGVGGPWYAALPEEAWPDEAEYRAQILKDSQEPHGDRRWGRAGGACPARRAALMGRRFISRLAL